MSTYCFGRPWPRVWQLHAGAVGKVAVELPFGAIGKGRPAQHNAQEGEQPDFCRITYFFNGNS